MGSVLLIVLAIFVGLLLLVAFWAIALYNGLIGKRNRFRNAFAQIEVQLQRRYDLIPNLVETAKGYMSHEKDTLEAVIAARNQAMGAMQAAAAAPATSNAMANSGFRRGRTWWCLGSIDGGREAYPDLKANQNMMAVQEELTSTENKVALLGKRSMTPSRCSTRREDIPGRPDCWSAGLQGSHALEVDDALPAPAPKVNFGG